MFLTKGAHNFQSISNHTECRSTPSLLNALEKFLQQRYSSTEWTVNCHIHVCYGSVALVPVPLAPDYLLHRISIQLSIVPSTISGTLFTFSLQCLSSLHSASGNFLHRLVLPLVLPPLLLVRPFPALFS